MKIAVFGDSYAETYDKCNILGWVDVLKTKNNDYEITNYSKSCTSLWWSYEEYLKHHNSFDKILFIVTSFGRLTNKVFDEHYANMQNVEYRIKIEENKKNKNSELIRLLHSAKDYFIHFQNFKQERFLHEKIVEELIKNEKVIIIPAFFDSRKYQTIFKNSLIDITRKELKVNFNSDVYIPETSYRANHLSEKNNQILAEKVHEIIQGTCSSISLDDFIFEKYTNPEKYWELK